MSGHPTRIGWFSAGVAPCEPVPPQRDRAYRVVLLGPPGVGKGTQASLLSNAFRACHLSTGDLFRYAQCDGLPSPAMQAALDAMKRGELVAEDIVVRMMRERVGCLRCHGGFLLDGFPRNVNQALALEKLLADNRVKLDGVIYYYLPTEQIVARISGRRTCPACRAVFHVEAQPPKVQGVCDHCGGTLIQREDDRAESVRVRMRVYEQQTLPLVEFYEGLGMLIRVEASGCPQEICDRALAAIEARRLRRTDESAPRVPAPASTQYASVRI